MKKVCESCKKTINNNQLMDVFVFMIGDLIEGKFYTKKTFYYHLKCLNGYESYKKTKCCLPLWYARDFFIVNIKFYY